MFTLLINGAAGENDMVYSGTTPSTVDAKSYTGGVMATAFLKFNNLTVNPTANFYVDRNVFDGVGYTRYNPRYYVTAGYMVNAKNRINLSSEMYYMTPPISQMGPNIQIQDQIDAITGNPELKTEIVNLFQLNYTCMAHRFLSLNAYCSYSHNSRLATSIFEPLNVNEHYYMLRTLQNRGFRNSYKYGIAASSRLIGNTLSLRVGLEGNSANQHGGIDYNTTRLSYNAQATYSFSNAHVTVAYQSKDKSMMTWGTVEKPQYYYVTLGWRYKNINLKGIAIVPFNSAYRGAIRKNMAENRTLITQVHSESYHRSFEIGIIYSFSYGKKLGSIPQVTTPHRRAIRRAAIAPHLSDARHKINKFFLSRMSRGSCRRFGRLRRAGTAAAKASPQPSPEGEGVGLAFLFGMRRCQGRVRLQRCTQAVDQGGNGGR
jgi:hypothetical protein